MNIDIYPSLLSGRLEFAFLHFRVFHHDLRIVDIGLIPISLIRSFAFLYGMHY